MSPEMDLICVYCEEVFSVAEHDLRIGELSPNIVRVKNVVSCSHCSRMYYPGRFLSIAQPKEAEDV